MNIKELKYKTLDDNKKYWLNEHGERYWINEELNITLHRSYYWVGNVSIIDENNSRRYIGSLSFNELDKINHIHSSVYDCYFDFSDFVIIDKNYYRKKKLLNLIDL